MKKFIKRFFAVISGLILSAFLWGCATTAIIPTRVPPLMDTLMEGETPNYKGWTFQGIVDARMTYFEALYPVVREFHAMGQAVSRNVSTTILGLLSAAGLAGAGALPLALKALPKGAVSESDHAAKVDAAGRMHPDEFEKAG